MKSISIYIVLFFLHLSTFSQSIDSAFKYFDSGQYEKAAQEFDKVLPLIEKRYGANDTSLYSFVLIYAGTSCEKTGQFQRAEQYFLKAKSIYEQLNALSSEVYITAINNLAELYYTIGNFETAEKLFMQILERNISVFGRESPAYVNLTNNIAMLYQKMGYYAKAETYFLESLSISRKLFGDADPRYATILNNTTTLYHKTGNYAKAEPLYQSALNISKKAYGEMHSNTVAILNNMGALYDDAGNYEKAEAVYKHVLEVRKKLPGPEHPDYALSANNLAQLYFKMSLYEKAEVLYKQSLEITGKVYGKEHFNYSLVMNNLGALYHATGDYEKAEMMYSEAQRIRMKVFGEMHPAYATSLNNLALLYHETGNYDKAEEFYLKALEIRRTTIGEYHPDYAASLNNMALFYQEKGNYEKAEVMFRQALSIRKKVPGETHPDFAVTLNNIAQLHADLGDYDKAEPLFLQALAIIKKAEGEMHADYASSLNNLAGVYSSKGDNKKAEAMYLQSMGITRSLFGENYPGYASAANNLALLYQSEGDYENAEKMYRIAMNAYLFQIKQQFSFLSESEKEKYLARLLFFFNTYQNFIIPEQISNSPMAGTAYDITLSGKGLLLSASKQMRVNILSSSDTVAINRYNSWIALRASLVKQYSLPSERRSSDTKLMEARANDLEKQLVRLCSGKYGYTGLLDIHWQDIQNKLLPGEAAIEFTDFPLNNGKRWTDSTIYAAILLKPGEQYPLIIPLFEEHHLDSLLKRKSGSEVNYINNLYNRGNKENQSGSGKGYQLYDLIWKPLEKYLAGIQTVYYSPSGSLHQLSFAAIPCDAAQLLSDRFSLRQLGSTARLIAENKDNPVKSMVLYGGINYDTSPDKLRGIADQYRHPDDTSALPVDTARSVNQENKRSGSWMYLEGTKYETDKIGKLAESKGIKTIIFTKDEAVEESLNTIQGNSSPDVIHISTHGFFFPDAVKNYGKQSQVASGDHSQQFFRFSDNPLLRAGLAFAGANHSWAGESNSPDLNDGIVTAYEISNIYIPNTDLVVLSACETGLGEIKGSEGVYGLQRAFKIAGAEYLLMSMWQIPDYQTYELMDRFYAEWFSGKSIHISLKSAQDFMKNKYPDQPFMWAAFVLVR